MQASSRDTRSIIYRNRYEGDNEYTYRILPVESALDIEEFNEDIQSRLRRSLEETNTRLDLNDVDEE